VLEMLRRVETLRLETNGEWLGLVSGIWRKRMTDLTQEEKDRLKGFETLADEIVDRLMGETPAEEQNNIDKVE